MRVLVCGGRDYDDYVTAHGEMFKVHVSRPITTVIEGGAPGADRLARHWANIWGVPVEEYPADWAKDGRAAGPIRNQRMLDEGKPDLVLAFPGGRGTADMVRRAKAAGVEVIEIKREDAT